MLKHERRLTIRMKVFCVDLGHDLRSKPVSGVEVGGRKGVCVWVSHGLDVYNLPDVRGSGNPATTSQLKAPSDMDTASHRLMLNNRTKDFPSETIFGNEAVANRKCLGR
jgi:hypothetical protein